MTSTSYSKPYMSITELVKETGLARGYLKQLARVEDAPIVFTLGGGKIYFKTAELDNFMGLVSERIERDRRTS